jgi:hypothetical protein
MQHRDVVAHYRIGNRDCVRCFETIPVAFAFLRDGVETGLLQADRITIDRKITILSGSDIDALRRSEKPGAPKMPLRIERRPRRPGMAFGLRALVVRTRGWIVKKGGHLGFA